jgi:hypothetical protein
MVYKPSIKFSNTLSIFMADLSRLGYKTACSRGALLSACQSSRRHYFAHNSESLRVPTFGFNTCQYMSNRLQCRTVCIRELNEKLPRVARGQTSVDTLMNAAELVNYPTEL